MASRKTAAESARARLSHTRRAAGAVKVNVELLMVAGVIALLHVALTNGVLGKHLHCHPAEVTRK